MEKELLYKYIDGRTSEAEEQAVVDWLRADPEHQQELNALWFVHNTTLVNAPRPACRPMPAARLQWLRLPAVRRCMQAAAALLLLAGTWYASRSVVIEKTANQYSSRSPPPRDSAWTSRCRTARPSA